MPLEPKDIQVLLGGRFETGTDSVEFERRRKIIGGVLRFPGQFDFDQNASRGDVEHTAPMTHFSPKQKV
jgi:hypothetical protein